jgi:hypothetical protein
MLAAGWHWQSAKSEPGHWGGRAALAASFESHHLLDDTLALFGYVVLLADAICAVLTDLAGLATHLDRYQVLNLVTTGFADWHESDCSSQVSFIEPGLG